MKVFTVTGLSGSGKTSTIECLIKELNKRGYSVGTVKEIHYQNFTIDTEGKNTFRHRQAGASTVTARGNNETDILYKGKLPIYDILSRYSEDFVILEGVRDAIVPEIALSKEDEYPQITDLTFALSGRFSLRSQKEYKNLPVIDGIKQTQQLVDLIEKTVPELMFIPDSDCCLQCGIGCRGLLAKIIKGQADRSDCVLYTNDISLKINGNNIAMVPFVQNLLRKVTLGVVSELKGYKDNAKIEIEINNGRDIKEI